ncbi:FecR domain-containing protein [Photorhabdus sp. SF281]|uniref:FecR domain-containing protein n=1 Tax=Photorhabdus sp. SF281 TaxID=3459527 RepID=UPI004043C38C
MVTPEHAQAWEQAQCLLARLHHLPPHIASPLLNNKRPLTRREAIRKLTLMLLIPAGASFFWQSDQFKLLTGDYHTAMGQIQHWSLPDSSQLTLNTQSSADVHYDDTQRLVHLKLGEMYIETHKDSHQPVRPFKVRTKQGIIVALGTKFSVRQQASHTQVEIAEGAVRIIPDNGSPQILYAGETTHFTPFSVSPPHLRSAISLSWLQSMIVADNLPLATVIAELNRYRSGVIRCDDAVANLRVSGTFPIRDTDLALHMLLQTYSLSMRSLTRYWITLYPPN